MNNTNDYRHAANTPRTYDIISFLRLINNTDSLPSQQEPHLDYSPSFLFPAQDAIQLMAQGLSVEIAKLTHEITSLSKQNEYLVKEKERLSMQRRNLTTKKDRALANINYLASSIRGKFRSSTQADILQKKVFFASPKCGNEKAVTGREHSFTPR